jgi:hypothetical protein
MYGYMSEEEVREAKDDYENGIISAGEFWDVLDSWDGDPVEMIG